MNWRRHNLVVCIDFGTTNTVAAWGSGLPRHPVDLPMQSLTFPSALLLEPAGTWRTGMEALNTQASDPAGFVRCPKVFIGTDTYVRDQTVTGAALAQLVFAEALRRVTQQLAGRVPRRVIVTHPASWLAHPEKVDELATAATLAALELGLSWPAPVTLPEPEAAGYAAHRHRLVTGQGRFAVLDMGGGTTDVTVIDVREDAVHVVREATGGHTPLGGEHFDAWLAKYVLEQRSDVRYDDLVRSSRPRDRAVVLDLRDQARTVKEQLCLQGGGSRTYAVPGIDSLAISGGHVVTYDELIDLIRGEPGGEGLRDAVDLLDTTLSRAPRQTLPFVGVLLVGGSSRIPDLHKQVEQRYRNVLQIKDPTTAVAEGGVWFGLTTMPSRAPRPPRMRMVAAAAAAAVLGGLPAASWLGAPVPPFAHCPGSAAQEVISSQPASRYSWGAAECVGLIDAIPAGPSGTAFLFGQDPQLRELEQEILTDNTPAAASTSDHPALTVIWLGPLSCEHYDSKHNCTRDGHSLPSYQSEQEELQALRFLLAESRRRAAATGSVQLDLHVVLANAGQNVMQAEKVARQIVSYDRRGAFGPRRVVVGGGDSRKQTQAAINILLDQGIPVISPSLTADHDDHGGPFVAPRPGYLTIAAQNTSYAQGIVRGIRRQYPSGADLLLFNTQDTTDYFTYSMVQDVEREASDTNTAHTAQIGDPTIKIKTREARSINDLDSSICAGAARPTVVYFADRWSVFEDFAKKVTSVCHNQPELVIGDGSVGRTLNQTDARLALGNLGVHWPMLYFLGGYQCHDLKTRSHSTDPLAKTATSALLDAARLAPSPRAVDCNADGTYLGAHVAPVWDAVKLAELITEGRTNPTSAADLKQMSLPQVTLSEGSTSISSGTVGASSAVIPLTPTCVRDVGADTPRSVAACSDQPLCQAAMVAGIHNAPDSPAPAGATRPPRGGC